MSASPLASHILSGIGLSERDELCRLIALLESVSAVEAARGSFETLAVRVNANIKTAADRIESNACELKALEISTAALRHRLWWRMSQALKLNEPTPYSARSAGRVAAALAIRTSERLSPSIRKRQKQRPGSELRPTEWGIRDWARAKWGQTRNAITRKPALPFGEVVQEEIIDLLASDNLDEPVSVVADPMQRQQIKQAHAAARTAMLTGGGWATFATAVSGAGFAPYMLAAQASAWIPMVSGPTLVSLLSVLVNPLTLLVGLGGLAWFGTGKASEVARSQLAARLAALLAMSGARDADRGLASFVTAMRLVDDQEEPALKHLSGPEQAKLATRRSRITNRVGDWPRTIAFTPPDEFAEKPPHQPLADEQIDHTAIGTATAVDLFWHAAAIDARVIEAADFSRAIEIGGAMSFALESWRFASRGSELALRGYTAEQVIMHELIASGHHVTLPEVANQPGYDLLVDGAPVQVKCGQSLSILRDHFKAWPDIPVIANAELVDAARQANEPWAVHVSALEGLELEKIESLVSRSLEQAEGLAHDDLLPFALAGGAARGGYEVWTGRLKWSDLPAWLAIDGAARGGLALGGGQLGAWLGLVALGPAGALILSPLAGWAALTGVQPARNQAIRTLQSNWLNKVRTCSETLRGVLLDALDNRIRLLRARQSTIRSAASSWPAEAQNWIEARGFDDLIAIAEYVSDLEQTDTGKLGAAHTLVLEAHRLAPTSQAVQIARKQLEEALADQPGLMHSLQDRIGWSTDTEHKHG